MRSGSLKKTPRAVRIFFVLAFLPLFFVFPYFGATNNPNENTRTFMTMAIVEDHTFQLDKIVTRQGWTNDMARVKGRDGEMHWHCVKGPATGYLGVPVYFVYSKISWLFGTPMPTEASTPEARMQWLRMTTWILRIFSVQLPCFLFLVWFERYLRTVTRDVPLRLAAVTAAGLGTNYLGYANMYVSHSVFAVAAFLSFGLAERAFRLEPDAKKRRAFHAFLAGLCAGWVTMLEYHGLPLSLVLALFGFFVFYRPLRLLSYCTGGLITILLQMFYQWRSFGNPLTPGHTMVENPLWAEEHKKGLYGAITPTKEALLGLSLPVGSGFFGMSPYMWLGFLALPVAFFLLWSSVRRKRVLAWSTMVFALCMAALWFGACSAIEWRAGWTLGARRLGAAPPFFAFGAVVALSWFARRGEFHRALARGLASGLALAGVLAVGIVGLVYNTLPETQLRPFMYFAVPLIQGGFVSHHIGEWFGWKDTTLWYVVALALLIASMMPAFITSKRERVPFYLARVVTFVFAFGCGLYPQLTTPGPDELGDHASTAGLWTTAWEPAGRDRLTLMRADAERYGTRRPCAWYQLADLERMMHMEGMAALDERRAGGARSDNCPRLPF
jgi:hypothetical protein